MIAATTLVSTPAGFVPAATLRSGDDVTALEDGARVTRPLHCVGHIQVDLARHPAPMRAAPVRLAAGAIAIGLPAHDLLLSPDHPILQGRALVQAQALRNGASIAQVFAPARMTYVRLELARHAILCVEALPIASDLDTGSRRLSPPTGSTPPDLAAIPSAAALAEWKARGCAPLRLDSAAIVPAHLVALDRARALGWTLTDDPALIVQCDGREVPTARFGPDHWQARLPEGARSVRLACRSFVPGDLDASLADRRRLGIALRSLRVAGRTLPAAAFGCGWHLAEPEWRWTDGDAHLALRVLPRAATLELRTAPGAVPGYWLPPA